MDQTADLENRQLSPANIDDNVGLSPTSKKVLGHCAVKVVTSPSKDFRTLIARPPNSSLDGNSSFHFARPTHPAPSFSIRPLPRAARGDGGIGRGISVPIAANISAMSSMEQNSSQNDITPTVESTEGDLGNEPSSTSPQPQFEPMQAFAATQSCPNASPDTNLCIDSQAREAEPRVRSKRIANSLTKETAPLMRHELPESVRQLSRATSISSNNNPMHTSEPRLNRERCTSHNERSARSSSTSGSTTSKISKQQRLRTPSRLSKDTGKTSSLPSQPSEEDLFYLLIHRLKKRDQVEAATAALREETEKKLREVNEENEALKSQLREAEDRCHAQETQNTAQRNIIERWKVKLGKVKSLVAIIGNDHEILRKDGHFLKSAQIALVRGKHQLQTDLRHLKCGTDHLSKAITQQRAELASMQAKFTVLEQSLALRDNRLENSEKLLEREKNRTSTLEAFIRNHSNRGLKQIALLQQTQTETASNVGNLAERIKNLLTESQSTIKAELGLQLKPCLEILETLSKPESIDLAQLAQIDKALRDISMKVDSQNQKTELHAASGFDVQNQQASRIIQQLSDMRVFFEESFTASIKLADTKQTNGMLQEKVKIAEATLAQINVENAILKETESILRNDVSALQKEVESLQNQLADACQSSEDRHELSKLRIQFKEISAVLDDATAKLKAKEEEVSKLEAGLSETKSRLQNSETQIVNLETEKAKFEKDTISIENRVRAEFTKASLLSTEQNRAWFEQQLHQIKREKATAEKSANMLKEQTALLKSKLAAAGSSQSELEITVTENAKMINDLESTRQEEIADPDEVVFKLKDEKAFHAMDAEEAKSSLQRALAENAKMKIELVEAQSWMESSCQLSLLQEKFDLMRDESVQKDENIAFLTNEIATLKDNATVIERLREEAAQGTLELKDLRKKLEDAHKENMELTERLKSRDDDTACRTAELDLSKQEENMVNLHQTIQAKDSELRKLQGRLDREEESLTKIEGLLRQFSILGANDLLVQSWVTLERRLSYFARLQESSKMLLDADTDEVSLQGSKSTGKRKRIANLTPSIERKTSPRCSTPGYKTTRVVYRKESISRSISCSPLKPQVQKRSASKKKHTRITTPRIKPFSQVQWDLDGRRSSPSQSIDYLSNTPVYESWRVANIPPSTPKLQLGNSSTPMTKLPPSPIKDVKVESHMIHRNYADESLHAPQEKNQNLEEIKGSSQAEKGQKLPKSILKERALPALAGREDNEVHTSSRMESQMTKEAGAPAVPRRQTRASSQYFKSSDNPSTILSSSRHIWAITQSAESSMSYRRPRRYGRKKGRGYKYSLHPGSTNPKQENCTTIDSNKIIQNNGRRIKKV
ncbi:hypothetical protein D8B26_001955 [Coccidioides posadasii str. Silveira]|uniref:uncharacterized protein n=1 Tax=Coccidioides posadasii (strain RMSCC 757 / Silveira) TaxID=443226 RepID=UPI001BEEA32E|nr:hypothetical protein D8B26_001955 [Coccidioides posadasii str. Silveira]